jgi:hypothetical protein
VVRLTPKNSPAQSDQEPRKNAYAAGTAGARLWLDYEGLERTVDVHLMNLRRKIETDPARPQFVQTIVWGWV